MTTQPRAPRQLIDSLPASLLDHSVIDIEVQPPAAVLKTVGELLPGDLVYVPGIVIADLTMTHRAELDTTYRVWGAAHQDAITRLTLLHSDETRSEPLRCTKLATARRVRVLTPADHVRVTFEDGSWRYVDGRIAPAVTGITAAGRLVTEVGKEQFFSKAQYFGLTLCCDAFDKGSADGIVCRRCYRDLDVGEYLGAYAEVIPVVPSP